MLNIDMLNIFFKIAAANYEFVHQGHCADGWTGPNSKQVTTLDCKKECESRPNVGYFAYSTSKTCACYLSKPGCPDDNMHNDHKAYRILEERGRKYKF